MGAFKNLAIEIEERIGKALKAGFETREEMLEYFSNLADFYNVPEEVIWEIHSEGDF